jgi:DNA polymerase elongation subunit (family B)
MTEKVKPLRRLFWDIETSPVDAKVWGPGWKMTVSPNQITNFYKIISIAYKWQHENKVHALTWNKRQDDKKMCQDFSKVLGTADVINAYNGDNFDLKKFRTRCLYHRIPILCKYTTEDLLKKSRRFFAFPSNKMDEVAKFLGLSRKIKTEFELWLDVVNKVPNALENMVEYNKQDVIVLQDIYTILLPYIDHDVNLAGLRDLERWRCPECASKKVRLSLSDSTKMGTIRRYMICDKCQKSFKISNKNYERLLIARGMK